MLEFGVSPWGWLRLVKSTNHWANSRLLVRFKSAPPRGGESALFGVHRLRGPGCEFTSRFRLVPCLRGLTPHSALRLPLACLAVLSAIVLS